MAVQSSNVRRVATGTSIAALRSGSFVYCWSLGAPTQPKCRILRSGSTRASTRFAALSTGDTILLASGARVRLQGINTPETVMPNHPVEAWGPEASQFTKAFIKKAGNRVRLTFSLERKDKYDRFLAFVWSGDVMLNEELVRAGLAYARRDYRYSSAMKRRFTKAQDEAQRAGRGIWSNTVATNTD